jgi:iron complex outermembrane receptor protein
MSVDHQERKIFFDRDRPYSTVGLSVFGYPATFGRVATGGTFNLIAPDPSGTTFSPDPRCPTTLNTDPEFPNSVLNPAQGFCNFNFAALSASAASLRRDSIFVSANYELSDSVNFFARFTSSNNESFGRYAPAPTAVGGQLLPSLAATNPNNPTANEPGGPYDLTFSFRSVPTGTRDTTSNDTLFDVLVGLDGNLDWFGGFDWEWAAQHSRTQFFEIGENFMLRSVLQQALDDGSVDLFGEFGPEEQELLRTNALQISSNRIVGTDLTVNWDLLQTDSGPWPIALGMEYLDEKFTNQFDAQSVANNVYGSVPGATRGEAGERSRWAAFAELMIPIGFKFELNLAGRWDHYSDFGDSLNPKISAAFRPTDRWLIRGSYGTGFRAPDLSILNGAQAQVFAGAVDSLGCFLSGQSGIDPDTLPFTHPCVARQYQSLVGGNPDLGPEESEQWSAGVVWSPTENITVGFDYYDIELTNQIGGSGVQTVLDNELLAFQLGRQLNPQTEGAVLRGANGQIQLIEAIELNLAGFRTSGFDVDFSWNFELANTGDWRWWVLGSHVNEFETQSLVDSPFLEEAGLAGTPKIRVNTGLDWSRGNWSGVVQLNWIDSTTASFPLQPTFGHISSWTTWDIQMGYAFGWDGKVTLGIRNVDDRDPPLCFSCGFPNWSSFNYDAFGRVPYIRYEQDL